MLFAASRVGARALISLCRLLFATELSTCVLCPGLYSEASSQTVSMHLVGCRVHVSKPWQCSSRFTTLSVQPRSICAFVWGSVYNSCRRCLQAGARRSLSSVPADRAVGGGLRSHPLMPTAAHAGASHVRLTRALYPPSCAQHWRVLDSDGCASGGFKRLCVLLSQASADL